MRQTAAALREANALFQLPDNVARMEEAVARAGDDPVRRMTVLLPVVEGAVFIDCLFMGATVIDKVGDTCVVAVV